MKTALCAAGIGVAMLSGYGLSAPPAQAGYVVTLTQHGTDVVATGSGPIDLTGLSVLSGEFLSFPLIAPIDADIVTGNTSVGFLNGYTGATGPASFGSGSTFASSGSGDVVGLLTFRAITLFVPAGYMSGAPLSDTSTYHSQTFSSLGVAPGAYEWTWGTGANQNFTLEIGAAVPEPSTWAMGLVGFGLLGLVGYRRTRLSPVNG